MKLDVYCSEPHFVDHTASVWGAIARQCRGQYRVATDVLRDRALGHGIRAVVGFDGSDHPTLTASIGDLRAARRAGRSRVALMEHGYGQSYGGDRRSADHPSYAGGVGRAADLFLHPNEHAASRDRSAYPAAQVEIVGCPKLDTLPRREPGPGPVICFSAHWDDSRTVPEVRSGFVHFREGFEVVARHYQVIGHGHPRFIARLTPWYERKRIEVVADFREVCRRADLYVCDNSSTIFEFASTGRPVIVLQPSIYRPNIDHGLRFYEAAGVGLECHAPSALLHTVAEALADPPGQKAARERALDMVYAYRTGAAQRAAAVLRRWAAQPALAVAA